MTKNTDQTSIFDIFGGFQEEETTATTTLTLDEVSETVTPTEETTTTEVNEENTTAAGFEKAFGTSEKQEKSEEELKAEDAKKGISTFEDPAEPTPTDNKDKAKAKAKSSTTSTKKKMGDELELTVDTVVKYAGQEIPVTRYFSAEQITNGVERTVKGEKKIEPISEKQLLNQLNDDFAELVSELTTLVFYKKKNIVVPVLQARTKGANKESSSEGSLSFTKRPSRIPFSILEDFIAIARKFDVEHNTEIHADVYFDYDTNEFFMDFPEQIVHRYWATRTEDAFTTATKFLDRNYRKVLEIHSHHTMAPSPSSTDDAAERSAIFYVIVGRTDKFFPEFTARTFDIKNQKHIPLSIEDIFEYPYQSTSINYGLNGVEVNND